MAGEAWPVFCTPRHRAHSPSDHPETPQRADILLQAALEFGLSSCPVTDIGISPIASVHSDGLLAFLQTAYHHFGLLPEGPRPAIPDSFAVRQLAGYSDHGYLPRSIWGQLGHYCTDNLTPILENTWTAAYWSAQVTLSAAAALDGEASIAYALCRPPGHHAYRDLYGGYCYLNNAAIAAEWLAARGRRPAILDIDYHHGNGTQDIFYNRQDVFFCSLHADPRDEYPYYSGFAHEIGRDGGEGFTLNLPLPLGTGQATYLRALEHGLDAIGRYAPDVLLLSVGFDTVAGDPFGGMNLPPESFREIGRELAGLERPLLIVQEGGYLLDALRPALFALLDGLASSTSSRRS